jgi:hypothetical protein
MIGEMSIQQVDDLEFANALLTHGPLDGVNENLYKERFGKQQVDKQIPLMSSRLQSLFFLPLRRYIEPFDSLLLSDEGVQHLHDFRTA